ncbi:MAG TPA: hypothetical protein VGK07_05995 [Candidatus Limnocylindria bacterium]
MLSGLNFRAIAIGWVIDVVGSNVISIAALVVVMVSKGIDLLDLADQAVFTRLALGPEVITVSFIAGSILSIVAAYVTARIAGAREIAHGVASSAAGIAVTLSGLRQMLESLPAWLVYGGLVLGVVLGYVGGWLRLVTKRMATAQ